jgi:hypothetical protein
VSSAKAAAASRRNGARGGRPSRAVALVRRVQALRARLAGRCDDIDPHDLDLILIRLCSGIHDDRRFFIRARPDGGGDF